MQPDDERRRQRGARAVRHRASHRRRARATPAGGLSGRIGSLRAFYALPAVRARLAEYLGGRDLETATAVYVTDPTPRLPQGSRRRRPQELPELLGEELEAARSLWDRRSLLVHVDLEHVHFDRPWEPFADRPRSAALQRPVVAAVESVLAVHGIEPLHLLTGRGHHLVWRIAFESPVFATLAGLGRPGSPPSRRGRRPPGPSGEAVGETLGSAYEGLGRVLEHLGHRVLERVEGCPVPVQLGAITVGPGKHGREIVSLDLSQFGDPLGYRTARLPFTAYLKGRWFRAPAWVMERPIVVVPVVGGDEPHARAAAASLDAAAALAAESSTRIPEGSYGTESLVDDYLASPLHRFHEELEATAPEPPERWESTYDRLDLASLPPCLGRILDRPNDLLLQPAGIQHVLRGLTALGWHPRHVAGLLRSKYERDYGWVPGIHFHEPGVRADFYSRLFAGLVACGRDRLVDFNCDSAREKGLCPGGECGCDLRDLAQRLLRLEGEA